MIDRALIAAAVAEVEQALCAAYVTAHEAKKTLSSRECLEQALQEARRENWRVRESRILHQLHALDPL
jgi:hypothetical protein